MRDLQFYDINEGVWTTGGVTTRFYTRSVQDTSATEAAGRPIFRDMVYLLKKTPGDRLHVVDRPMRDSDKMEFAEQWKRFQEDKAEKHEGQPLAEWPQVTRSQVEELAYFRIHTVEELARVSDGAQGSMGGLFALRDKARSYLDKAASGAQEAKLKAERDELAAHNKTLEERLANLERMQAEHSSKKGK